MNNYTIGVDLGGTNIKAGLFDGDFNAVEELSLPTEAAAGPAHVLERIRLAVTQLTEGKGIDQQQITCMGMGIPGLLDPEEGLSIFSPNFPGWEQIHIVNAMKPFYDYPVYIDNDVRVNLYGEWQQGAGKGCRNLVLLTLGTGLGSGIVDDGKVLYGTTFSAGEIGHMNMYRQGRTANTPPHTPPPPPPAAGAPAVSGGMYLLWVWSTRSKRSCWMAGAV
jgi:glucokinase